MSICSHAAHCGLPEKMKMTRTNNQVGGPGLAFETWVLRPGPTAKRNPAAQFRPVVGADGLHSRVRSLAFGDDANFVRYLGYYVSIFTVPNYLHLDRSGLYYGPLGKKVGIFSGGDSREAKASFFFSTAPLDFDRHDTEQQKGILRDHFQQEGWEVPRLLEIMPTAPDFYFDSVSQVKMKKWSSGRAVLLGDAAYSSRCPSKSATQSTLKAIPVPLKN
jgi:2-polyprenyl-6-methoxyphenol hydroxylase-like FAD-dependent oxidoreductase